MKLSFMSFIPQQLGRLPPVDRADLRGQTVVVVGANTGLGFEAAKHFARMKPQRLILACRNKEKGNSAVAEIAQEIGFTAELWILDLGKFSSVIAFADKFEKDGGRLDILVANAAVASFNYRITSDGWEEMLQVNNLSNALLCILLAPRLVETANKYAGTRPRIVIVSSGTHYWVEFEEEVLSAPSAFLVLSSEDYCVRQKKIENRYPITKLLNVFFSQSLSDLLKDTPVIVNAVCPGFCYSELRREFSGMRSVMSWLMERAIARTQEEGARQLIYAAVGESENPDKVNGAYLAVQKISEASDFALGEEGRKRRDKLWDDLVDELSKVDGRVKGIISSYSRD